MLYIELKNNTIIAVKLLITINRIQNKAFVYIICVVYIYYVYINIHTYNIHLENIYMHLPIFI